MDCPVCESGAEEMLRHFLKECRRLGGIRDIWSLWFGGLEFQPTFGLVRVERGY